MLDPGCTCFEDGKWDDGRSVSGAGHVEGVPETRDECLMPLMINQDALVKDVRSISGKSKGCIV